MVGVFDPNRMKLFPGAGCLQYFRSHAPNDDIRKGLFVYRHMDTEKFMLAWWIGQSVFIPILELGAEPVLNDEVVKRYRQYCHPQDAEQAEAALKKAHDNEISLVEEMEYKARETRAQMLRDYAGIKGLPEDGTIHLPEEVLAN
jgi:hypothetical protein